MKYQQMKENKPLILVSNDDGYQANGITALVQFIKDMAEVIVCAPDSARSGFSRAFSATLPLTLKRKHNMGEDVEVWSCNGTPVDCVKLALDQLCTDRKPDLILGGINHGDNSTINAHYSGTMGVVMEGCMKHIPSVAFSHYSLNPDTDMAPLRHYVRLIVEKVLQEGLPDGICLNVNFPALNQFKGIKICRMTRGEWDKEIVTMHHPRGHDYYWMVGHYVNNEPKAEDTDQWALANGYVAITPTTLDLTAHDFIPVVESWHL